MSEPTGSSGSPAWPVSWTPPFSSIAAALLSHADSDGVLLQFEDDEWTGREVVERARAAGAWMLDRLDADRPRHVGVLMQNTPAYFFILGGAAITGVTLVGVNPTRRGVELARDVEHTDCQIVIVDEYHRDLVADLALPAIVVDDRARQIPVAVRDVPLDGAAASLFTLIFTSGTTNAPKAVRMTQGRMADNGAKIAMLQQFTPADALYASMPLFHSNALITAYTPALMSGATLVLKRRFSASEFIPDCRRYGATYANYVGKALSYVLATPVADNDATVPLTRVFGNEAAPIDAQRFAERFGCSVADGYGSTEGGVAISKTPDTPAGALGIATSGRVAILNADGAECVPAEFDSTGRLMNSEAAIGEIVNLDGQGQFEGYYNDPDSSAERVRDGRYWTGDLGYMDVDGFVYFAGRTGDWLRVDGENFAAAPVERILGRWDPITVVGVYAVPDVVTGDQVMAAIEVEGGPGSFDPGAFSAFLAAQNDLGTKWSPAYVRVSEALPRTETQKVLKRILQRERWECTDPVWHRPSSRVPYTLMTAEHRAELRARFESRNRADLLDR